MQGLTDDFTKANPDIKVNWVTLEENDLRQKSPRTSRPRAVNSTF